MEIKINGQEEVIEAENITIKQLLLNKEVDPETVIVVHNNEIIRKENWEKSLMQDGDELEVLKIVGGG